MPLDRLSAGWRRAYVERATATREKGGDEDPDACIFCRLANGPVDAATGVVDLTGHSFVVLNAYPYGSGHVLVLPRRHVAAIAELTEEESASLWHAATRALAAIERAYAPDGANLGANLGRAGGAGIPGHLHLHVLPRWDGDTNFMTAIAETRVLPEDLDETYAKLREAFEDLG
jgi:diadenosine tetraphosphate (Ap4A) HIT family hydrolase